MTGRDLAIVLCVLLGLASFAMLGLAFWLLRPASFWLVGAVIAGSVATAIADEL